MIQSKAGLRVRPGRKYTNKCATVVFLLEEGARETSFYLARKKQNIHTDDGKILPHSERLNGYGGKWEPRDGTIFRTAIRELAEESAVSAREEDLILVAIIEFFWPGNKTDTCDMEVFFFTLDTYAGDPMETEQMGEPTLYTVQTFPANKMLPADESIINLVMRGNTLEGKIFFSKVEGEMVIDRSELNVQRLYK